MFQTSCLLLNLIMYPMLILTKKREAAEFDAQCQKVYTEARMLGV